MSAETEPVLIEQRDGGVVHLVLNRPAKRNALSSELRQRLVEHLDAAADDDSVGAVVISGAGGHFCAGFDLNELAEAPDPVAVFADANHYHQRVHTFPKPLIAAISGTAVAGGLDLALMCDLRLAGSDAALGQPQVRHGIPAAYGILADVVGAPAARELCLTGRVVDADEALRIGLVNQVVAADQLVAVASELAADIASLPISAATKQSFVDHQPDHF